MRRARLRREKRESTDGPLGGGVTMKEVWVIVEQSNKVMGHGDNATVSELATKEAYSTEYHPAFTFEDAARQYLENVDTYGSLKAVRLEIQANDGPVEQFVSRDHIVAVMRQQSKLWASGAHEAQNALRDALDALLPDEAKPNA